MHVLAQNIAAANRSLTMTLDVKNISSLSAADVAGILQALNTEMTLQGNRLVAAPLADLRVQLTLSESVEGYLLVAEIHRGETRQVEIVAAARPVVPEVRPSPGLVIQRKAVWQQSRPVLDFAQVATDAGYTLRYILEPDRLAVYEFNDGMQVLQEARPISRLHASRDLRGWLHATDATHVEAYIGGVLCAGSWTPGFTVDCKENPAEHWPMGPVGWPFAAPWNYFSGAMTFPGGLIAKWPAFYSAASPPPATGAQTTSRWILAGLDGRAQLFEGMTEPTAIFSGWGGDILSIAPACGAAWQVVVTGTRDWTQPDRIQIYEIVDRQAVAVGGPLDFPGPILALWPSQDGRSARAVSRNLQTGLYEASIVSVSCGN